ncbi:tRNA (adenosine(37)-N6)-threonylcarbamoyltransferase complex dimerization subunit type 1 TsaB [Sphingomonas sp. RS2018]
MRTLVISTATAACSVALIENDQIVASAHDVVGRGHAERLVPMIADLPDGGRASRILVDCGPGSFTGVRVGLAAAIGLGIGWGVPVAGFSSLSLIAAAALDEHPGLDGCAVVIEGGHGELFVQNFEAGLSPGPLVSLKPADVLAALGNRVAVGNGGARLLAISPTAATIDSLPDASRATLLPDALASLPARPIYGRAPDAKPKAA